MRAFNVRFSPNDRERVVRYLKSRYGEPKSEHTDRFRREGRPDRKVYNVLWESGRDKALLSVQPSRRRAQLEVWRGKFEQQIYKIQ